MMAEPMIHGDGDHRSDEQERGRDAEEPDVAGQPGEEVDQHDLHAVEGVIQDGRHEAELQQPDEGVVVDGGDPVVRIRPPADHRGVHDVGEQEEDDREAAHAVEEPAVLALVTLVERAELAFPFGLAAHRGSAYRRLAASGRLGPVGRAWAPGRPSLAFTRSGSRP